MRQKRKGLRNSAVVVLAAAACIILLAMLYAGGRMLEKSMEKPEVRGDLSQRYAYENLVEYRGEMYRPRSNIFSVLLMGIDRTSEGAAATDYRNGGQADFLRLLVIDSAEKKISQIQIDRDTMTPITVLGVLGNRSGIRTAQVSLSHGFGDGKKQSCELTKEAVENLFFNAPIDSYMALNMDGISVLNDMVGGVTVTLEDDFSALDAEMTPGTTLTLMGEQAEYYTRYRRNIGEGSNAARMQRQEAYISKISEAMEKRVSENKEYVGVLYDALLPYMITDISRGRLINEVWAAKDYKRNAVFEPKGTHIVGADGFMQFYADEAALEQIVMELFYIKVK